MRPRGVSLQRAWTLQRGLDFAAGALTVYFLENMRQNLWNTRDLEGQVKSELQRDRT